MKKNLLFVMIISIGILMSACGSGGSSSGTFDIGKVMPLGDSITYDDAHAYYDSSGNNLVPEGERTAYRSFLAYDLNDADISYDFVGSQSAGYDVEPPFDPDNEGHPGWTSFEIANKVYSYLEANPSDIILLHIGTNDRADGRVDGTERIINEIERWANDNNRKVKIFVALIINRWLWDKTIEKYNNNLRAMLEARNDPNIVMVDMTNLLAGSQGDYLENTHPSKQGYEKIADKWFEAIMDNLDKIKK